MRHLVIPDVQAKYGHDFTYLTKLGHYIVEKKPDKIICLGDFADMSSLSSYDVGSKKFEGQRYWKDIEAAQTAMSHLMTPIELYNIKAKKNKEKQYKPELILTLGNHENRINRAVNLDPKLDGLLSVSDLGYETFGWKVHDFLEVVVVDGIAYSHYFTSGLLGRPVTTAAACLAKKHMSCVQGHQQGLQVHTAYKADGSPITSIIAGSFYEHDEDYMGPQGNKHWRGFLVLHEVQDGSFDAMPVSLNYLNKKYNAE